MPVEPSKPTVWGDTETFSRVPLKKHGGRRYAEDPSTEVLLFPFAIDPPQEEVGGNVWWSPDFGNPVKTWDLTTGAPCPPDLKHALEHPDLYNWVFHNLPFDRAVLRFVMGITLPLELCYDTAAQARSLALPPELAALGAALRFSEEDAKLAEGKALINRFCKPAPKNHKADRYDATTHPDLWERFVRYSEVDVHAMRRAAKVMSRRNYLNPRERDLWLLTERMNERGLPLDVEGITRIVEEVDDYKLRVMEELKEITGLDNPNSPPQLKGWMAEHGVVVPNMKKTTLEALLESSRIPQEVHNAVYRRLSVGRTPITKLEALLARQVDGRLHDALLYCGASRTGRYSSRGINMQNIPRGSLNPAGVDECYELVRAPGLLPMLYGDVIDAGASMIRGAIVAPPGHKIVASDLSAIESRVLAFLAGEEWKLQAFRDIDNPAIETADIYCRVYAQAFSVDEMTVSSSSRQQGKVIELACGFQGGVPGLLSYATMYGVDLGSLWEPIAASAPQWAIEKSARSWAWACRTGNTAGLSSEGYRAAHILVKLWRESHPATVAFWSEIEDACKAAIRNPGTAWKVGDHLTVGTIKGTLLIKLPSGRYLHYHDIKLVRKTYQNYRMETYEIDGVETQIKVKDGTEVRETIQFMGIHPETGQWVKQTTYSGKLAENVTQAVARDVLTHTLPLAEAEGYNGVLLVHDEDVTIVPDDERFTHQRLSEILATVPDWAPGLPLAAAGYESYRYKKD